MDSWALPLLEVTALMMLLWCLADAWRRGRRPLMELIAAALCGLSVEQLAIWTSSAGGRPDAYHYGPFTWMATPDVPLVIFAAWGALLYAAMAYSDSLAIPRWMRPAVDGLYALMLDLTMDLVAVRLGLWTWQTPPDGQWFGIPYSNFGGWLVLAVLVSAGVRAVRAVAADRSVVAHGLWLVALTAVVPLTTLTLLGRLFTGTERDVWPMGLLALMAVVVLMGGLIWRLNATRNERNDALAEAPGPAGWLNPAMGLPLAWHLSYLGIGTLAGVLTGSVPLFLTGAMAAFGMLLVLGLAPLRTQ